MRTPKILLAPRRIDYKTAGPLKVKVVGEKESTEIQEIRFGPFAIEHDPARLKRGPAAIKLRPKSLKVLRYLAERPGQFVSKEELLRDVWEGRIVSDSGLRLCVREIRAALGDSADSPQYVETVTGRGYRFLEGRDGRAIIPEAVGPVVGRQTELDLLNEHFLAVLDGRKNFTLIGGEPGIGKTTLLNNFTDQLPSRKKHRVLQAQCIVHYGDGEAYGPLLQMLAEECRQEKGSMLVNILRRHAPSWLLQLPGVVAPAELETLHQQLEGVSPERMMREFLQLLEQLSAHAPLIVVIEDLHWSDQSTIDLLGYLAQSSGMPFFLIATYRPVDAVLYAEQLRDMVVELKSHGHCIELSLELLTIEDVSLYLRGKLNGVVSEELTERIYERTGGNPLFLVNIVEDLVSHQLISMQKGTWVAADRAEHLIDGVPETLRTLISRRINALPDSCNLILETGSVVGLEFSVAAISSALESTNVEIERECEKLAEQGLFIEPRAVETWPDGTISGRYRFQHPLYAEVLYDQIGDARKALINRCIGEELEQAFAKEIEPISASLAVYFDRAQQSDKALHYRIQSAELAQQRHAYPEFISHLQGALKFLREQPDSPERDQQEIDVLVNLGPAQIATQGYAAPDVEETYNRAQSLLAESESDTQLIPVLWNLAAFYLARGQLSQSNTLINQVVDLAEKQDDLGLKIMAQDALAQQLFFEGNFKAALKNIQFVIDHYDFDQHRHLAKEYGLEDPCVACRIIHAYILTLNGEFHRAKEQAKNAEKLAYKVDNPHTTTFFLMFLSFKLMLFGDTAPAKEKARSCLEICDQFNIHWGPFSSILESRANARIDHDVESLTQIDTGLEEWRSTGASLGLTFMLYCLGDAALALGETERAQRAIEEAITLVESTHEGWIEPDLHRQLGLVMLKLEKEPEAAEYFHRALQFARVQETRLLELWAALELSQLMLAQGKSEEVKALLAPIVAKLPPDGEIDALTQAHDILNSLA